MGLLVEGTWRDDWYDTGKSGGRFQRDTARFRHWVTPDGGPGLSGEGGFKAEPGRYHLYVSLACPWAHRTLIFRELKGLQDVIGVSVVHWHMGERGWSFERDEEATGDQLMGLGHLYEVYLNADPNCSGRVVVPDPIFHARFLHEIYTRAAPRFTGRVTVPVVWDKRTATIVSNESSEIIRMLGSAFDQVGATAGDYYPQAQRDEIDRVNARIYDTVNNGVYKAGFATTQEAYDEAVAALFESLDWLEERLLRQRWLVGDQVTEADWRLFTTLARFDPVYVGHFKCNLRRIADYPALSGYLRELYQWPGVAETVSFRHIKGHYYTSHPTINPTRIVPMGPVQDLTLPHGRG